MPPVETMHAVEVRAEREHRQDDELVRGVAAADVKRGVRLGVALLLRLLHRRVERGPPGASA